MKRFLIVALVGVVCLGLSSAAYASVCAFDAVPASTLLFPFVAYDYEGGVTGQTTLFAITNVSSDAQIVHITIWSDFSVAILDFNITLTGYDVQTINIRDILSGGLLPTYDPDTGRMSNIWDDLNAGGTPFASGPYSPNNDEANVAALPGGGLPPPESTWDGVAGTPPFGTDWYLRCNPDDLDTIAVEGWISSPINYVDPIPTGTLTVFQGYLQSSNTAQMDGMTFYSACDATNEFAAGTVDFDTWWTPAAGATHRPTWMYVTADVVGACNKDLPDGQAATYFSTAVDTAGVVVQNVLVGDVIYFDPADSAEEVNFSEADLAVHIEAQAGIATTPTGVAGKNTTFYARYHLGIPAAQDYREPLPTAWALRYMDSAENLAQTWIRAWKGSTVNAINPDLRGPDTGVDGIPDPITGPSPSELYANTCQPYTVYIWDENEGVQSLDDPGAQEPPWSGTPGGTVTYSIPNLLPLETQEVNANEFFLVDDFGWMMFIWPMSNQTVLYDHYQTWMGARYQAFGNSSAGLSGAVLANYNCDSTQVLPQLGIGMYSE